MYWMHLLGELDWSHEKTQHQDRFAGPKARELLARDALVVSPSYPRDYPFVMSHGKGAEIWDVDGNRFLDFAAGIAVCSTGHSHPAVVQAIKDAADKFLHISSDYWHEGQVRLAERMNALSPMKEPVMSFFAQSGTESGGGGAEAGALHHRARPRFIGFLGGFHGRTMGSLSFTSSKYTQQKGFFPTMPGVTHVPYPNNYRPLFAGADQGRAVLRYIEDVLFVHNVPAERSGRDPDRADPGRGRLSGAAGRIPAGPARAVRPARHSADLRRSAVGHRPHRQDVRRAALGRGARHHDAGQGPGLRAAHRHGGRRSAASCRSGPAARTAIPSAAIRCAAPLRSPPSISSTREYCANAAKVGEYFMRRCAASPTSFPWSARCAARA